ncbi:zinc finger BED domain-containing protein RICESLEEPER 2-like [Vigna unguiculata]|uniref:zinc finger BED domain-containing protein RICESLEEPER 2-like n=1 Tax=Vigna unguiculata TaxID=3917 RepID=UPI001015EED5|nr:zinc finger BED domain-containing protein RICESLEEPER 2-like [Vigna unguiculata]
MDHSKSKPLNLDDDLVSETPGPSEIQDGLKVVDKVLHNIRESVKYVKSSDGRTLKFKECVSDIGINMSIGLRLDVTKRWNLTYLMLESAIRYKAFEILKVVDRSYKNCPFFEEWDKGEKMCQFLEPFYDITNMIFGSSYPTSNLYFMEIWKIQLIIEENFLNEDVILKTMALNMKEKFQKYSKEYSIVLAFGDILDPRLKDLKMYQNESKSIIGKSEVDVYLDEPTIDDEESEDFDVLKYWKTNEKKFPMLSIMARDVLSISITIVASKSAFRKGGRILSKYRSSILPNHVQMLICTQS